MDIDECILSYQQFSREIFGDERCGAVRRLWCFATGEKMYNTVKLEDAIKKTIRSKCDADTELLLSDKGSECKVYIPPPLFDSCA